MLNNGDQSAARRVCAKCHEEKQLIYCPGNGGAVMGYCDKCLETMQREKAEREKKDAIR
jgi:hypothetical protein